MITKISIRTEKIAERNKLAKEYHKALSEQITARLKPYIHSVSGHTALYYPVRKEVNISSLMKYDHICLPAIVTGSKEMIFREAQKHQKMEKNTYGIMQPVDDAQEVLPDIIVVPVVAFDRSGYRIGYGGGYYDSTLRALRRQEKIKVIGVAFGFQEVEKVPAEDYDERLDIIITEKETLEFA